MIDKKELILYVKEKKNKAQTALYCSSEVPRSEVRYLKLNGKEKALIICVGSEKKARAFLRNFIFETINVSEDFDIEFIKDLLSMGYRSDFDKAEGEWILYNEAMTVL